MIELFSTRPLRLGVAVLLLGVQLPFGASAQNNNTESTVIPLDDFTERSVLRDREPLEYPAVRESDILWEQRIWRVVDVREKMNLPFVFPEAPLFQILADGVMNGELTAYSTENDHFTVPLSAETVEGFLNKKDTISVIDFNTGLEVLTPITTQINWENVKRFRIKEAWFFDARTGTLSVRILGIAPLIEELTEQGDFKFERPLFWIHYPSARQYLARQKAYTPGNNLAANTSWEDMFEMRYFASTLIKENNLYDRKIESYLTGTDMLTEAGKLNESIFSREMDVWER